MFCGICGVKIEEGVKFCGKCGASATIDSAPQQSQNNAAPVQANPPQQPNQQASFTSVQQQEAGTQQNAWQYFTGALKKYAVFEGRARRAEYWWFTLFIFLISLIFGFLGFILSIIVNLAFLLPSLAVSIRRMHDVGKSGWFVLVPIYNLILCFTAGNTGPNQYGPDPKGS